MNIWRRFWSICVRYFGLVKYSLGSLCLFWVLFRMRMEKSSFLIVLWVRMDLFLCFWGGIRLLMGCEGLKLSIRGI